MRTTFFASLIYLLSTTFAFAGGLDKNQQAALADTQELLNNQARLSEFTKGNPSAAGALDKVKQLTNNDPKKQAELQAISSDIFTSMVNNTNGDNISIMSQLQDGLRNPASFMNSLTPEQQAKIKAMAAEIDAKK